jgi:hypothetical protein
VKKCGYKHREDGWAFVISGVQLPGFASRGLIRYITGRYIARMVKRVELAQNHVQWGDFGISEITLSAAALLIR